MEPLYSLRRLRRSFGRREVLNIPELDLAAGKVYGLLGPNGSGKTTLMRLLAFLDAPSEGEVFFAGQRVGADLQRFRARVVWVPQWPVMFSGSLQYNVEYPMRLQGMRRGERHAKSRALLQDVGLAHLAAAPARRLSGGEAQRASIARALAAGAEVILFDEPTANVDHRSRGEIIGIIRTLHQTRRMSLLVTTHDVSLARALCGEMIHLVEGRLAPPGDSIPAGGGDGVCGVGRRGVLLRAGEGCRLVLEAPGDAAGWNPEGVLTLVGMAENGDGVIVRVRDESGQEAEVALGGAGGSELARTLTLGTVLSTGA